MANNLNLDSKVVFSSNIPTTLPKLASDPTSGMVHGDIYWNTTKHQLMVYSDANNSWQACYLEAAKRANGVTEIVGSSADVSEGLATTSDLQCAVGDTHIPNPKVLLINDYEAVDPCIAPNTHVLDITTATGRIFRCPHNGYLYISSNCSSNVTVFDPSSSSIVTTITAPYFYGKFAYHPASNLIFAAVDGAFYTINPVTNAIVDNVSIPGIGIIQDIVYCNETDKFYATAPNDGKLVVIDPISKAVISIINVGYTACFYLAYAPTSNRIFVACNGDDIIKILDPNTNTFVDSISTPSPFRISYNSTYDHVYYTGNGSTRIGKINAITLNHSYQNLTTNSANFTFNTLGHVIAGSNSGLIVVHPVTLQTMVAVTHANGGNEVCFDSTTRKTFACGKTSGLSLIYAFVPGITLNQRASIIGSRVGDSYSARIYGDVVIAGNGSEVKDCYFNDNVRITTGDGTKVRDCYFNDDVQIVAAHCYLENIYVPSSTLTLTGNINTVVCHAANAVSAVIDDGTNNLVYLHTSFEYNNGLSGGTKTINWNYGLAQTLTLNSAPCVLTLSNPRAGTAHVLRLIQDGVGGKTVTWPANVKWSNAVAPTLSTGANKIDVVTLYYDGTNYYGSAVLGF